MYYVYDSALHIITEYDYYIAAGVDPFINTYTYEEGLLKTYTRHFDDFHQNQLRLEDTITYFYDGLKRLTKEKRQRINAYYPQLAYYKELNYEYNENEIVITTEGYPNGTSNDWIRMNKETRSFSADSLLLTVLIEPYNDSTTLITYAYDGQRHLLSALTQKHVNGEWENEKLVEYHYNALVVSTLPQSAFGKTTSLSMPIEPSTN